MVQTIKLPPTHKNINTYVPLLFGIIL